jgi:hypothetical protein
MINFSAASTWCVAHAMSTFPHLRIDIASNCLYTAAELARLDYGGGRGCGHQASAERKFLRRNQRAQPRSPEKSTNTI